MEVTTVEQARKTDKSVDFMLRLFAGEEVVCSICGEGVWKTLAPGIYECDHCKKRIVGRFPLKSGS